MTKVSSKGQVVIPSSVRKEAGIDEGDQLAVYTDGSIIYIKKVDSMKLKRDFQRLSRELSAKASKLGITPEDVQEAVDEVRYSDKDNDR